MTGPVSGRPGHPLRDPPSKYQHSAPASRSLRGASRPYPPAAHEPHRCPRYTRPAPCRASLLQPPATWPPAGGRLRSQHRSRRSAKPVAKPGESPSKASPDATACGASSRRPVGSSDQVVGEAHAGVADVDRRPGDELVDLVFRSPAEGAAEVAFHGSCLPADRSVRLTYRAIRCRPSRAPQSPTGAATVSTTRAPAASPLLPHATHPSHTPFFARRRDRITSCASDPSIGCAASWPGQSVAERGTPGFVWLSRYEAPADAPTSSRSSPSGSANTT